VWGRAETNNTGKAESVRKMNKCKIRQSSGYEESKRVDKRQSCRFFLKKARQLTACMPKDSSGKKWKTAPQFGQSKCSNYLKGGQTQRQELLEQAYTRKRRRK